MIIRFVLYKQYSHKSQKFLRFQLFKEFKPTLDVFYGGVVRASAVLFIRALSSAALIIARGHVISTEPL